jgi:hypothetical protein
VVLDHEYLPTYKAKSKRNYNSIENQQSHGRTREQQPKQKNYRSQVEKPKKTTAKKENNKRMDLYHNRQNKKLSSIE